MASEKKLASNARYLATQKTITIRLNPEEHAEIQRHADEDTGGSVAGYFKEAVRAKMGTDRPPEGRTRLAISNKTLEQYQKPGESLAQTAQRLFKAGIEAEGGR